MPNPAKFYKINDFAGGGAFWRWDQFRRKHSEALSPVQFSLGSARCPTEGDILEKSCAEANQEQQGDQVLSQISKPDPQGPLLTGP